MKDWFGYKDKVCVITGCATGMGRTACEMLVDLGAKVYALDVVDVDVPGIEKYYKVDLSSRESIDEVFAQLPEKFDKYFHFAGVGGAKCGSAMTIVINFVAVKYIMEEYVKERIVDVGAIVICSAMAATRWEVPEYREECEPLVHSKDWDHAREIIDYITVDLPHAVAYRFSKRCLGYYASELAVEMCKKKVRVNCVKPGATRSGLLAEFANLWGGEEEFAKQYGGLVGRLAESREMGEPAVFLGSDMASFISGVELAVEHANSCPIDQGIADDIWGGKRLQHMWQDKK